MADSHDTCSICSKAISKESLFIQTGAGGIAHAHCYERQHRPMVATTLHQVARGCGDPLLAADVIGDMVPYALASAIVAEFNRRRREHWLRRCQER